MLIIVSASTIIDIMDIVMTLTCMQMVNFHWINIFSLILIFINIVELNKIGITQFAPGEIEVDRFTHKAMYTQSDVHIVLW